MIIAVVHNNFHIPSLCSPTPLLLGPWSTYWNPWFLQSSLLIVIVLRQRHMHARSSVTYATFQCIPGYLTTFIVSYTVVLCWVYSSIINYIYKSSFQLIERKFIGYFVSVGVDYGGMCYMKHCNKIKDDRWVMAYFYDLHWRSVCILHSN